MIFSSGNFPTGAFANVAHRGVKPHGLYGRCGRVGRDIAPDGRLKGREGGAWGRRPLRIPGAPTGDTTGEKPQSTGVEILKGTARVVAVLITRVEQVEEGMKNGACDREGGAGKWREGVGCARTE